MAISLDARDNEAVSRRTHEALTKKQRSTKASSVLAIQLRKAVVDLQHNVGSNTISHCICVCSVGMIASWPGDVDKILARSPSHVCRKWRWRPICAAQTSTNPLSPTPSPTQKRKTFASSRSARAWIEFKGAAAPWQPDRSQDVLSSFSTASGCERPTGRARTGTPRPAAKFPRCH